MQRLAVIPNTTKDPELSVTKQIVDLLCKRATVVLPEQFRGEINDCEFAEDVNVGADAAIIVGGDVTVIGAALPCAKAGVPMLIFLIRAHCFLKMRNIL